MTHLELQRAMANETPEQRAARASLSCAMLRNAHAGQVAFVEQQPLPRAWLVTRPRR